MTPTEQRADSEGGKWNTRRAPHMERYTFIQPVITEDGEQFAVYLRIGNQQFRVGQFPDETLQGAEWMQHMLCIALDNIVKDAAIRPSGDAHD